MTTPSSRLAAMQAQGWRVSQHAITSAQAYLWGIIFALPFLFLAGSVYRVFLLHRAVLQDYTTLILLAITFVSVPLHEALHGLGWKLAGRLSKGDVFFFINNGIPMCACRSFLSTKAYLTGTLLPFFILGGSSFLFLLIYPGTVSILTTFVNLVLPGADLFIAYRVLRSEATLIADNLDGAGFIALAKDT